MQIVSLPGSNLVVDEISEHFGNATGNDIPVMSKSANAFGTPKSCRTDERLLDVHTSLKHWSLRLLCIQSKQLARPAGFVTESGVQDFPEIGFVEIHLSL